MNTNVESGSSDGETVSLKTQPPVEEEDARTEDERREDAVGVAFELSLFRLWLFDVSLRAC